MTTKAERERLAAERAALKADTPRGLSDAWTMIEDQWNATFTRARQLPESMLHERVNGEWSFVQTQRHLVLVTDCWLRRTVKGMVDAYHPWGIGGSWLTSPRRWGLDPDADPSLDEVLAVRSERMDEVHDVVVRATSRSLGRSCTPPDTPGHPRTPHTVLECLHVLFKEEWQHHRYATRDLDIVELRLRTQA